MLENIVQESVFAHWLYDVRGDATINGESVGFHASILITWGHDVILETFECDSDHPRVTEIKEAVLEAARERVCYHENHFPEPPDLFPDVEIT